ncbi:MAG: hypothetical protein WA323_13975, partial [Candidatus Nitrosopolaris sp.]
QVCTEEDHDRKLLQGCKAVRVWRVQVQKERSGAYTRAPSLSGTRQGFIHYIWDKLKQGTSIRSLIMTVSKIDTVYA